MENIIIKTYKEADVEAVRKPYQCKKVNLLKITSKGCDIAKVYDVHSNTVANRACKWKALSSDKDFTQSQ